MSTSSTSFVAADDLPAETERPPASAPAPGGKHKRRMSNNLFSALSTIGLIALGIAICEIGSAAGLWSSQVLPAPSTIFAEFATLPADPQFWADARRTGMEITVAIVCGTLLGFGAGLTFWKLPLVGRIFEPYLVSFYAVPMVLFYPVMIVLVGINAMSVIILATIMAAIPMALNTAVGLNSMPAVYMKLARSLKTSPRQTLFAIAIPAAGPFIIAGLRMAVVYALIGTIAMEFVTAQAGLGYRIRYLYEIFDNQAMFAYILAVLLISVVLTVALVIIQRMLLRGRNL